MMARTAQYGVFPVFRGLDGRLAVQPEMIFPSEEDAKRAAEIFAGVLGGAVAFSRMTDRETGTVEKGVIIGRYGVMAEKQAHERAEPEFAPEAA
jgi:hypothetical protein